MQFDIMSGMTPAARIRRDSHVVVNLEVVDMVWLAAHGESGVDETYYWMRCDEDDPAWIGLRFLGQEDGFEQPEALGMPDDYEKHPDVLAYRGGAA